MKKILFVLLLSFAVTITIYSKEESTQSVVSDHSPNNNLDKKKGNSRFTIGGGGFFRLGSRSDMPNGGFSIEVNAQKYYQSDFGVGVLLNYSRQIGTIDTSIGDYNPGSFFYKYSEKHSSVYAGPSILKRFRNDHAGLYIEVGAGGIYYNPSDKVLFGQQVGLAGDLRVSEKVSLGLKASGMFSSNKLDNGKYLSNFLITFFIAFGK